MAAPTIIKGEDHFTCVTYEGNGGGQKIGKFVPFTDSGTIAKSCIFDEASSAQLTKTFTGDGNKTKFTFSIWMKRNNIGSRMDFVSFRQDVPFIMNADNTLSIALFGDTSRTTNRTFEDTSKWYHFVLRVDSSQSTANDRIRLYVDGDQITSFSTTNNPSQDEAANIYTVSRDFVFGNIWGGSYYTDAYFAEVNYADGQSYGPDTFGLTDTSTGRWIPKSLSGITYGTNGFRLEFANSAGQTIGDDTSGNGNDLTVTNIAATDITTDTPTQNFVTFDPNDQGNNAGATAGTVVLSEGNLRFGAGSNPSNWDHYRTSKAVTAGKFYVEVTLTSLNTASYFGCISKNQNLKGPGYLFYDGRYGWGYATDNGKIEHNNSGQITYGSARSQGHVIGIAVDMDNGKLWFSEQGTYPNSGNPATGANPAFDNLKDANLDGGLCFVMAMGYSGAIDWNFGQKSFAHSAPTGFVALQQDNFPETGDFSFKPDLVWTKNRDQTDDPTFYDSSRGVKNRLRTNSTDGEDVTSDGLTKFLQGGYQTEDDVAQNSVAESYVSWMWKAGEGTTSANTDGVGASVACTIQKNTDAGFSIVEWTGGGSAGTIEHGLGAVPQFMFYKRKSADGDGWIVYHHKMNATPEDGSFQMQTAGQFTDDATLWNDTAPTAQLATIGSYGMGNTEKRVGFFWTGIEGFSKFGVYEGTSNAVGTYVYTGFKPALVMVKAVDANQGWVVFDNARYPTNPNKGVVYWHISNVERVGTENMDFLANGFKCRDDDADMNQATIMYAAWAKHPFVGNGTNPATAV